MLALSRPTKLKIAAALFIFAWPLPIVGLAILIWVGLMLRPEKDLNRSDLPLIALSDRP